MGDGPITENLPFSRITRGAPVVAEAKRSVNRVSDEAPSDR